VGTNERAKIVLTDDEIAEFIERSRTATMATVLPDGRPHLVAMWYAVVDGEIWFETKAKSQKAVNVRRDPTITVMGTRRSSTTPKRFCAWGLASGSVTPARTPTRCARSSTR
jgi:PPOX class probable F420-dependent enzyme